MLRTPRSLSVYMYTQIQLALIRLYSFVFFILDKKAACLTLGGYLKTFRVTLLECEIECCDSSNCNTQKLSLTQDAVRVFPPGNKN